MALVLFSLSLFHYTQFAMFVFKALVGDLYILSPRQVSVQCAGQDAFRKKFVKWCNSFIRGLKLVKWPNQDFVFKSFLNRVYDLMTFMMSTSRKDKVFYFIAYINVLLLFFLISKFYRHYTIKVSQLPWHVIQRSLTKIYECYFFINSIFCLQMNRFRQKQTSPHWSIYKPLTPYLPHPSNLLYI